MGVRVESSLLGIPELSSGKSGIALVYFLLCKTLSLLIYYPFPLLYLVFTLSITILDIVLLYAFAL